MLKHFKLAISIILSIIVFTEPVSNIYANSNNDSYKKEIVSKKTEKKEEVSSNDALKEESEDEKNKEENQNEVGNLKNNVNNVVRSATEGKVVEVSNWNEFEAAYNDGSVTKIKLISDIEKTASRRLTSRTTSIEIDGRRENPDVNGNYYHKLSLSYNSTNSNLPFTSASELQIFDMHDLIISQKGVGAGVVYLPYSDQAFVTQNSNTASRNWKFRFGNISTDNTTDIAGAPIARLIMAQCAEITFYGKVNIRSASEIAYPGSVVYERGAEFVGKVVTYNVSCFWYYASSGGTGSSRNFTVLDGAKVNLQGSSGTAYPAIYENYSTVEVGEKEGNGAEFSITMKGSPYSTSVNYQKFIANSKSKVNITTTGTSDVISISTANSEFRVYKDAEFYAIAKPNNYIINITGNNAIFEIDSAAKYDIRHMGKGQAINQWAFLGSNNSHVYLKSVDISLWEKASDYMGPATFDFGDTGLFDSYGPNSATSTNQELADEFNKTGNGQRFEKYSRISGINTDPEVEFITREEPITSTNWVPNPNDPNRTFVITDADKTIEARSIKGWVPDENGIDEYGNVNLIPVYARGSLTDITLYSSLDNQEHKMTLGSNGIYKYTFSDFNQAGSKIIAFANKKSRDTKGPENEAIVRDATPPEPVDLTSNVDIITNKIEGLGEPGTTITYKINGVDAEKNGTQIVSTVDSSGKWVIETPEAVNVNEQVFKVGDTLQFFSTDSSGNKTPINQVTYRDRTFEKGTIITVLDGSLKFKVPSNITFGSIFYSAQNGAKGWGNIEDENLEITDTREIKKEWTLKAKMSKQLTKIDGTKTYDDVISYAFNDNDRKVLTNSLILIESHTNTDNDPYVLLENERTNGQGIYIDMPKYGIIVGEYNATIEWNLEDVPTLP